MEAVSTRLRLRVSPVVGLLAETLSLPRNAVTLVSGHSARDKIVRLDGLDQTQIERRLQSAVGKEPVAK